MQVTVSLSVERASLIGGSSPVVCLQHLLERKLRPLRGLGEIAKRKICTYRLE
jgi:hypothetical protein